MPTTLQPLPLKRLTAEQLRAQDVKALCPCCQKAVITMLDPGYSHVIDWLVDTSCDHSRLCRILEACDQCFHRFWTCGHCGSKLCHVCLALLAERSPGR